LGFLVRRQAHYLAAPYTGAAEQTACALPSAFHLIFPAHLCGYTAYSRLMVTVFDPLEFL
jgi:hypothetical protein